MKTTAILLGWKKAWLVIACLLLISFTLQTYITQTHVHGTSTAAIAKILVGPHDKTPIDDGPQDCPFCQAVAHDGHFFLSAMPLLLLSLIGVELATPTFGARKNADVPAHNWQSRAPPRH